MFFHTRFLKMMAIVIIAYHPCWMVAASQKNPADIFDAAYRLIHESDPTGAKLRTLEKMLQDEDQLTRMECSEQYICDCCDGEWKGATLLIVAMHKQKLGCIQALLRHGSSVSFQWDNNTVFDLVAEGEQGCKKYIERTQGRLKKDRSLDDDDRAKLRARVKAVERKLTLYKPIRTALIEAAKKQVRSVFRRASRHVLEAPTQEKIPQDLKTQKNREKRLRQKMRKQAAQEVEQKIEQDSLQADALHSLMLFSGERGENGCQGEVLHDASPESEEIFSVRDADARLILAPNVYVHLQRHMAQLLEEKRTARAFVPVTI
jgi:hypothetical protein